MAAWPRLQPPEEQDSALYYLMEQERILLNVIKQRTVLIFFVKFADALRCIFLFADDIVSTDVTLQTDLYFISVTSVHC